jgi:hypothetical protein
MVTARHNCVPWGECSISEPGEVEEHARLVRHNEAEERVFQVTTA